MAFGLVVVVVIGIIMAVVSPSYTEVTAVQSADEAEPVVAFSDARYIAISSEFFASVLSVKRLPIKQAMGTI